MKKSRTASKHKKDVSRQLAKGNPLELNDGDAELQEHLDPLIGAAVADLLNIKAPPNDETVSVTGTRLWTALNNAQNWRNREAAAQAYLNYLSAGVP